jgi:hypothetical protein
MRFNLPSSYVSSSKLYKNCFMERRHLKFRKYNYNIKNFIVGKRKIKIFKENVACLVYLPDVSHYYLIFGFWDQRYIFGLEETSSCCFGRIRIIFRPINESSNQQINEILCRALITALVVIKIKCYLTCTLVRNNINRFLEVIGFQRQRMNIFTVNIIGKLHVLIWHFRLKNSLSSCIYRVDMKNIQFVVQRFLLSI